MKKHLLALCICGSVAVTAQVNWQNSPGAPTNGFWDMDTMNNKLYVSFGGVYEFDGTNWTWLNNYNASLNTPNKTKSCVKTISNKLYCGAKDFNTGGEGDMHYYDGTNWNLMQSTDFPYHGNNKIRAFANYGGSIYASGIFRVPTAPSFSNIAKWNGTDWVDVGRNFTYFGTPNEIRDMEVLGSNLYITDKNNVWKYNGTTWDSLFNQSSFPMGGGINGLVVYNNELYMSGNFSLDASSTNVLLAKYNGTTFTPVSKGSPVATVLSSGTYANIGRMNVVNGQLMFIAKKASDNATYLVSYNGSSFSELTQLAVSGDYSFGAGYEYTTYTKIAYYGGNIWIGGNYQKIGGQALQGVSFAPYSSMVGIKENGSNHYNISLYPNPSSGDFRFSINSTISPALEITDVTGKVVRTYASVQDLQSINTGLSTGLYFYQLKLKDQVIKSGKIIIK